MNELMSGRENGSGIKPFPVKYIYPISWLIFVLVMAPAFFSVGYRTVILGPTVAILLGLNVVIIMSWFISRETRDKHMIIFVMFYLVNLGVLLAIHTFMTEPYRFFKDDFAYHTWGDLIASSMYAGEPIRIKSILFTEGSPHQLYWYYIAYIYAIFGTGPTVKILHCLFVTVQMILMTDICRRLFDKHAATIFILFVFLYTGFYVQAVSLLKESSVSMLTIIVIWGLIRLELEKRAIYLLPVVGAALVLGKFRFFMPSLILLIYLIYLVLRTFRTTSARVAFLLMFFVIYGIGYQLYDFNPIMNFTLHSTSNPYMKDMDSFFVSNQLNYNVKNFLVFMVHEPKIFLQIFGRGLVNTFLGPFPWVFPFFNPRWTLNSYSIWAPGMLLVHFLIPFSFTAWWKERKRYVTPATFIWVGMPVLVFIFAFFHLGEPRRKDLMILFVLLYGAVGMVRYTIRWDWAIAFWMFDLAIMINSGQCNAVGMKIFVGNLMFAVILLFGWDAWKYLNRGKKITPTKGYGAFT